MGNSKSAARADRSELQQQNSVTDSLGGDAQSMEEYKKRLRRRRKKASDGCWDLTCYSWLFLLIALLQGRSMAEAVAPLASRSQRNYDSKTYPANMHVIICQHDVLNEP